MPDVDLSYAVGLPPAEAVAYFRKKGVEVSASWQDVWQEAHARAFTVAGVAKTDLLADIKHAVDAAIAEGRTAQMFVDDLMPTLKTKGWWGKKEAVDPSTGEVKSLRQGSPSRLNLIYRQNTQSAYNAGRYKQQKDNAKGQPYWQYVAVLDQKTRPSHAALDGTVFRHDDPIWDTHYPPNGWNCRCRVRARSQASIDRAGLKLEDSRNKLLMRDVQLQNPSTTGAVVTRTVAGYAIDGKASGRMFWTDVGFSYNPGQRFYVDAVAQVPTPPQKNATNWKELGLPRFRDIPDTERLPSPTLLPAAQNRGDALKMLENTLGFTGATVLRVINTPIGKRTLSRELLPHMVAKVQDARERYASYVLPTLQEPQEIWLKEHADGKLRESYLALFQGEKTGLLVAVRINQDGTIVWNYMQRDAKGMDAWREGWLVYKKI